MSQMCGTCKTITALLFIAAGGSLAAFGLGSLKGDTAHLVAGILFVVIGLAKLLHGFDMCPMCKK